MRKSVFIKKILPIFLGILTFASAFMPLILTVSAAETTTETPVPEEIIILSVDMPNIADSNTSFEAAVMIKNNFKTPMKGIVVGVSISNSSLVTAQTSAEQSVAYLEAGAVTTVYFSFMMGSGNNGDKSNLTFKVKENETAEYINTQKKEIVLNLLPVIPSSFEVLALTYPKNIKKLTSDFKIAIRFAIAGSVAQSVKIALECPIGITTKNSASKSYGIMMEGASEYIEFNCKSTEETETGLNIIRVSLTGQNTANYEFDIEIWVDPADEKTKAETEPVLNVIDITAPEDVRAGDTFKILATVVNIGVDVKDLTFTMIPTTGIIKKSSSIIQIDTLPKDGETTLEYEFIVTDATDAYYNQFELHIEYGTTKKIHYLGVNVISDEKIIKNREFEITSTIPENVKAGEDFKMNFTIKNKGNTEKEIFFTVKTPDEVINKTINTFKIGEMKNGESITKTITFNSNEANAGKYIIFEISVFGKETNVTGITSDIIYANQFNGTSVENIELPEIIIENIDIPGSIGVDQNFNVGVKIKNTGADAENLLITLTPATGMINKTSATVKLERLKSGESKIITYTFMTTKSCVNGYNPINIVLKTELEEMNQYSGLIVSNPESAEGDQSDKLQIPVVIINHFNYGGTEVYGSKNFDFKFEMLNTHKTIAVKDLKITLSSEEGIFNPKSGSNTFFIDNLDPLATIEQSIELIVKSDAKPDSYGLTITMSYKNEKGEASNATEVINIPVQQETRFSIGEIPMINDVTVGDEAYVNVKFSNLGKSQINNIVIKVIGEGFMSADGESYAGNIEAGGFKNQEFYLMTMMPGFLSGEIQFTYENALGEIATESKPISFNVMEKVDKGGINPGIVDPNNIPAMNPVIDIAELKKGGYKWLFSEFNNSKVSIIAGAVIFIGIFISTAVVLIKNGRKEEEDDDEI